MEVTVPRLFYCPPSGQLGTEWARIVFQRVKECTICSNTCPEWNPEARDYQNGGNEASVIYQDPVCGIRGDNDCQRQMVDFDSS